MVVGSRSPPALMVILHSAQVEDAYKVLLAIHRYAMYRVSHFGCKNAVGCCSSYNDQKFKRKILLGPRKAEQWFGMKKYVLLCYHL